jgi:hypothetical protein
VSKDAFQVPVMSASFVQSRDGQRFIDSELPLRASTGGGAADLCREAADGEAVGRQPEANTIRTSRAPAQTFVAMRGIGPVDGSGYVAVAKWL